MDRALPPGSPPSLPPGGRLPSARRRRLCRCSAPRSAPRRASKTSARPPPRCSCSSSPRPRPAIPRRPRALAVPASALTGGSRRFTAAARAPALVPEADRALRPGLREHRRPARRGRATPRRAGARSAAAAGRRRGRDPVPLGHRRDRWPRARRLPRAPLRARLGPRRARRGRADRAAPSFGAPRRARPLSLVVARPRGRFGRRSMRSRSPTTSSAPPTRR